MSRFAVRGDVLIGHALSRCVLVIAGGTIAAIRADAPEGVPVYDAAYVAPGFIDLQVNGGFGVAVGDDPAAIRTLAARLPETGVTAFLPTIITAPPEFYPRAITAFHAAKDAPGARPLGLHLEGPFLSSQRHGAHRRAVIEAADPGIFDALRDSNAVRLVTLAPERPGALGLIHRLVTQGIVVSLGHTDATYEQFIAGVDAGARMATHLYNAMSPFNHRAPGAIGAALHDARVTVGLIADGVHSHPASLALAFHMKRTVGIALVTDMMAAAGMPPGDYLLGGRAVIADGTAARLPDGTLAGSLLTLDRAVRNMVQWTGASVADALTMASAVPARLLGAAQIGTIRAGADADLVLLDGTLAVQATIIRGEITYQGGGGGL